MKTILITGGAGFLGSHLCRKLVENNNIICVDNLQTGKEENIQDIKDHPHFTFFKHDIIKPLFIEQQIDQIYNLACPASPTQYQYNAINTIKTNVLGVINMLGLAKKHHARILQASTSEVYGDPIIHPQTEEYKGNVNPIGPRACYDEGKRCAETLMFDYHRQHKVDIRIIRIFNTYGPAMDPDDGRVVSNFIMQALRGEDITIYGKGQQTRSFCFVKDLIEGMVRLMNKEGITGPINVGNPEEFTIKELAEEVIKQTHSTSKIIYKELPADDPVKRKPDITKARTVLAWEPEIRLPEGISITIDYFKRFI